jgi:diacylglycerol kinase family enzyme
VTWYRQCVDIQLHHEFTNFCGVKDGKIHYIYIQVKQLKYDPAFISTIIIDIKSTQTQQYRYDQSTKTMYVYGSRGISLNEIDTFFKQISQKDKKNNQKIAWLATDIKRSQDSTQVSYIQEYNEYNKRNKNNRTEKYT